MANSCVFIPNKGATIFKQLKKQFGYDKAKSLFYLAINPQFIKDNKSTLSLNEEGVPSYDSFMRNTYVRTQLEDEQVINSLQKNYDAVEDTIDNYNSEINDAFNFNKNSPFNDKFIATVDKQPNGKLRTVIRAKTQQNEDIFKHQYSSYLLNQRLANIFTPIGITAGALTKIEVESGRVGVTDFYVAKTLASDFSTVIRVANNMEGAKATSEEFAHLIIGCFIDDPLVKRSIEMLANKPEILQAILGDDYDNTVKFHDGDISLVAEEALGHIFQEQMMNYNTGNTHVLIKRAVAKITSQFKDYDLQEIEDALIEAESAMNSLAKDFLSGTKTITKEDIISKRRDVRLNALSTTIDKNIEVLKIALKSEQKRYNIGTKEIQKTTKDIITDIKRSLSPGADVVFGILNYTQGAVQQLKYLQQSFVVIGQMELKDRFRLLKRAKLYIDSYGQFINALNDAIGEAKEYNPDVETPELLKTFEINGQTINIEEVVKELNNINKQITSSFYRNAKTSFIEFIKPFMGESITIETGSLAGKTITAEELLNEANSDISFLDRWLDAMGDSSDVLLQVFDLAVKTAKDKARLKTIKDIQEIQKLRMDAEALGITSFDWMFEVDKDGNKTGNYISETNYGQYARDLEEFLQAMDEKYGVNPRGENAQAKANEIKEWHKEHSASIWGVPTPKADKYINAAYSSLSSNHKEILNRFLLLKTGKDAILPENRVDKVKAIQMRKNRTQRMIDSLSSPSALFDNVKESIASSIFEKEDDDQLLGNRNSAFTDFSGREFMSLPVLYTARLQNPNELTNDVFSSLIAYSYMANTYGEMDNIIDELEIGKSIVENSEQRKVNKTRGSSKVIEKFKSQGETVTNPVYSNTSNIISKLNDFFESQVYGRYLKDEGTWEVFGKIVSKQKLTSKILEVSSFAQLGFNFLANFANITTGVAMTNIEAASSQYFSIRELAKADAAYVGAMKDFMAEITNRNKKSKLALFDQLFNIKQNFEVTTKKTQKKNWFERIFGSTWAFIGQEAGDHWLYNRTAIAMSIRKKILYKGKEVSLWEALQAVDRFKNNSEIKELNTDEIKELDGKPLNVALFGRQVAEINHGLFGIYNQDDAMAANRISMGRLLMQYRKWIKPQMNKRFQAGQKNLILDQWEEGYYRTILRLGNDLLRGKVQLGMMWSQMKDFEKKNVIKALTEIAQFIVIWGLANWMEWPDDKNRPWAVKMAEYSVKRLAHETGGLTPSTVMIQENLKTIKEPMAAIGVAQDMFNLFNSVISPEDWTDEISSGPYKGLSTLEKNITKAPLPIISQIRQVDKFVGKLDNSINFYARPAY